MTYDGDGNLTAGPTPRGNRLLHLRRAGPQDRRVRRRHRQPVGLGNQIASWVYDNSNNAVAGMTDPIGQLTTETSYSGGAAYTIQQTGFNVFGESLGETVTIPATAGRRPVRQLLVQPHLHRRHGLPFTDKYPAAGGLPAETVSHTYYQPPEPGLRPRRDIDGYAQPPPTTPTATSPRRKSGPAPTWPTSPDTYDPHTRNLTDQLVSRSVSSPANVDDEQYTYDLDGNLTSQVSTRLGSGTATETQCFPYDGLDQLTAAWTATDKCASTPTSRRLHRRRRARRRQRVLDHLVAMTRSATAPRQVPAHSLAGGTDTTTTE